MITSYFQGSGKAVFYEAKGGSPIGVVAPNEAILAEPVYIPQVVPGRPQIHTHFLEGGEATLAYATPGGFWKLVRWGTVKPTLN